mmetsp:Transcript_18585/g.43715  ORF Transcript_18585/g.43715 Transcript_18585/m.43715 type:complete len:213 (+) Transcript_18585:611-1249(+)
MVDLAPHLEPVRWKSVEYCQPSLSATPSGLTVHSPFSLMAGGGSSGGTAAAALTLVFASSQGCLWNLESTHRACFCPSCGRKGARQSSWNIVVLLCTSQTSHRRSTDFMAFCLTHVFAAILVMVSPRSPKKSTMDGRAETRLPSISSSVPAKAAEMTGSSSADSNPSSPIDAASSMLLSSSSIIPKNPELDDLGLGVHEVGDPTLTGDISSA